MKKLFVFVIALALLTPGTAVAHPGKTDKKGGHTCRTNCKKYGLKTGQYHKHKKKKAKSASKPASKPAAKPAAQTTPQQSSCDTNYSGGCVPIASDVDCAHGSGDGPAYLSGTAQVVGSDIYGLDADSDGTACEQD